MATSIFARKTTLMKIRFPAAALRTLFAAAVLIPFASIAEPAADKPLAAALQPILAGEWRSEQNKARDVYRHPAQTLEFFGVRANQTVIEVTPGAGWYSEILAPLLRDNGNYIAALAAADKFPPDARGYVIKANNNLREKFNADAARYGRASVIEFDPNIPSFGKPASADAILTFRNVHNWTKSGTDAAYFRAFFAVLKPGGILGVEDHRAKPGTPLKLESGYLPEDYVIKLATDAGFELAGRSEVNANPADTADYPKGVWTLPPTLRLGEEDKAKYLAIGESDRFTLRFVKPSTKTSSR